MTVSGSEQHAPSRVQELATYLRDLAIKKGPEAKLPTARELGQMFSMSQNTIRSALELLEAQHVLLRRHGSGIYVSPKIHRKSICILFYSDFFHGGGGSPFWGIFWSLFAEEMERRLASTSLYISFHLVIQKKHQKDDLPEEVITMIERGILHGVIAVGMDAPTHAWFNELKIPVVAFAGPGKYFVGLDGEYTCRQAVAQLARQGCRSIGVWVVPGHPRQPFMVEDTLRTFRSALQNNGLTFDPALVQYGDPDTNWSSATSLLQQGHRIAWNVFGSADTPRPDGIFIPMDMITSGALVAFHKLGITLGHDLKVATHANKGSPVLFGAEEDLILLEFDPAEIVQALFAQMELLLAGQIPPEITVVKPHLLQG